MSPVFSLPAELNIYSVLETRDQLLAWATTQTTQTTQSKGELQISAKEVAEVDGAGLQLLAALSNMEQPWRLVEASTAFTEACTVLGLSRWLDPRYLQPQTTGVSV